MSRFAGFALAGTLGLMAIVVPPLAEGTAGRYDAPLFPVVRAGVERFGALSVLLLLVAGAIVGLTRPRRAWRWGLATVLPLPLITIAEIAVDPTSHNLWPLELIFYGAIGVPAAVGAMLAARLRRRRTA